MDGKELTLPPRLKELLTPERAREFRKFSYKELPRGKSVEHWYQLKEIWAPSEPLIGFITFGRAFYSAYPKGRFIVSTIKMPIPAIPLDPTPAGAKRN